MIATTLPAPSRTVVQRVKDQLDLKSPAELQALYDSNKVTKVEAPRATLTEWCASWADRRAESFSGAYRCRTSTPLMVVATESKNKQYGRVEDIREAMRPHREARRALKEDLAAVRTEREEWAAICEGDECAVHDAELEEKAHAVCEELTEHLKVLEELDEEQRAVVRLDAFDL